jgi:hypothetical protein
MNLDRVQQVAAQVLASDPGPVVRHRLLRDVLGRPPEDGQLVSVRESLAQSRWVRLLAAEQWEDGSWGRLHSQDSGARQKIPTTEVGVERSVALGLQAEHPILQWATRYLVAILRGTVQCRDRPEKNDRWETGVQLFAAASLAMVDPEMPVLDRVRSLWAEIARRTFASGSYDAEAEIQSHRELTGASVKDSYLVLDNKYTLALLGSRPEALPCNLEEALLDCLWHRQGGIRYLAVPLSVPPQFKAGSIDRWFSSHELLSRFPGWPGLARETVQWLWAQRTSEGWWDFGPRPAFSPVLPLSESWRKRGARQIDWTVRVLVLLRRFYHFN